MKGTEPAVLINLKNRNAVFMEGVTFKAIIPLPHRKVADTVNDTVNDTVTRRLAQIILNIEQDPGLRASGLIEKLNVSKVTIKRDMQKIRNLVEY